LVSRTVDYRSLPRIAALLGVRDLEPVAHAPRVLPHHAAADGQV